MTTKAKKFRELMARPGPIVIIGAHNGLSGRIGEEAGFDGLWASGFEISASYAVPDANILTMAENLAVAKMMNDATQVPVIADCDNGYGNAINVIRAIEEYERAGIAGICMEDNIFPKRCSFYAGVKRELSPVEEHAGKVRAAKATQRDRDFVVIARTEALIAGWGMEEALHRGRAYADAGADMVLIHSKSKTPDEVLTFAKTGRFFAMTDEDRCQHGWRKESRMARDGGVEQPIEPPSSSRWIASVPRRRRFSTFIPARPSN